MISYIIPFIYNKIQKNTKILSLTPLINLLYTPPITITRDPKHILNPLVWKATEIFQIVSHVRVSKKMPTNIGIQIIIQIMC